MGPYKYFCAFGIAAMAAALAFEGVSGWGWFLAAAVIASIS